MKDCLASLFGLTCPTPDTLCLSGRETVVFCDLFIFFVFVAWKTGKNQVI